MEFISPFWDCLFRRCHLGDHSALLRVSQRVHAIGMTQSNVLHRLCIFKRLQRAKIHPHAPLTLQYLPEEKQTPEVVLSAVSKFGNLIQFLHPNKQTAEVCSAAINQTPWAINMIHPKNRTPELYLEAVKIEGTVLCLVPIPDRTFDVCLQAVKTDGFALPYVPHRSFTREERCKLYLTAVRQCSGAIKYVPLKYQTPRLCRAALDSDVGAMEYIHWTNQTPELCLMAVRQHGMSLQFIDPRNRTPEVCLAAVQNCPGAIMHFFK
uniref:DUF4116 domain-containing protein n=1 Tax=viral metagenome TaxID=1070528 RepID=A0A6C0BLR1_9ZZZZ